MITATHYTSADPSLWSCRQDDKAQRIASRIKPLDLLHDIANSCEPGYALLGFCSDEGVARNLGRRGAKLGPNAIRRQLANLPAHKTLSIYDAGNIVCDSDNLESAQQNTANAVKHIVDLGLTPLLLGGGHEIAWAHYQGLDLANRCDDLAIVNFDAHIDMRPLLSGNLGSSGTPFLQIAQRCASEQRGFHYSVIGSQAISNTPALYDTAQQYDVTLYSAQQCQQHPDQVKSYVKGLIERHSGIYLTICLDVFNAAFAPGVSAVNPRGLAPWHIEDLLHLLINSKKLVGVDVAELNPEHDNQQQTAKLAASIISEVLHGQ